MTLNELVYQKESVEAMSLQTESHIVHRKYYDDRWHGDRDGYMEITFLRILRTQNKLLFKIRIESDFQTHRAGNIEWHDHEWGQNYDVISSGLTGPKL